MSYSSNEHLFLYLCGRHGVAPVLYIIYSLVLDIK